MRRGAPYYSSKWEYGKDKITNKTKAITKSSYIASEAVRKFNKAVLEAVCLDPVLEVKLRYLVRVDLPGPKFLVGALVGLPQDVLEQLVGSHAAAVLVKKFGAGKAMTVPQALEQIEQRQPALVEERRAAR